MPQIQTAPATHLTDYVVPQFKVGGKFQDYDQFNDVKIARTSEGPVFRLGDRTFLLNPSDSASKQSWIDLIHTDKLRDTLFQEKD